MFALCARRRGLESVAGRQSDWSPDSPQSGSEIGHRRSLTAMGEKLRRLSAGIQSYPESTAEQRIARAYCQGAQSLACFALQCSPPIEIPVVASPLRPRLLVIVKAPPSVVLDGAVPGWTYDTEARRETLKRICGEPGIWGCFASQAEAEAFSLGAGLAELPPRWQ